MRRSRGRRTTRCHLAAAADARRTTQKSGWLRWSPASSSRSSRCRKVATTSSASDSAVRCSTNGKRKGWWAENYDKVMELYNVQRFNHQSVPLPTTPKSEDESSKEDSPVTPPLDKERLPRSLQRPTSGVGVMGYSSSRFSGAPLQWPPPLPWTPVLRLSGASIDTEAVKHKRSKDRNLVNGCINEDELIARRGRQIW
ncbi:hypothetical protein ACQ4PT_063795 [Festuca glaucescens]